MPRTPEIMSPLVESLGVGDRVAIRIFFDRHALTAKYQLGVVVHKTFKGYVDVRLEQPGANVIERFRPDGSVSPSSSHPKYHLVPITDLIRKAIHEGCKVNLETGELVPKPVPPPEVSVEELNRPFSFAEVSRNMTEFFNTGTKGHETDFWVNDIYDSEFTLNLRREIRGQKGVTQKFRITISLQSVDN